MNERIKLLAEQSTHKAMWPSDPDAGELNVEKFAELIVQDCIAICISNALEELDSSVRTTSAKCGFDIKQHFGINT